MKGLGLKLLFCVAALIGLQIWNFITQNLNRQLRFNEIQNIKEVKLKELAFFNKLLYELKSINEFYGTAILLGDLDLAKQNNKHMQPLKEQIDFLRQKHFDQHEKLQDTPNIEFLNDLSLYLDQADSTYENFINQPNDPDIAKSTLDIGQLHQKIISSLETDINLIQASLNQSLNSFQEASSKSHFSSNIINIVSIVILIIFGFFVHDSLVRRLKNLLLYLNKLRKDEKIPQHNTKDDEIGLIENQIITVQQDLMAAKQKAEDANQTKTEFLANMNHELRTPLNGIMGMTEYLNQSNLDELQRQCIETIDRSSHLLLDILSDILDMSKLNQGKIAITPKPTCLANIFKDMEKVLIPSIHRKSHDISLEFHIDESVPNEFWIDPKCLKKLLLYIIGNAIKFSDAGTIKVSARMIQPTELEYLLFVSIEDQGVGIAPDQLTRLFEAFTQVDESSTRHYGGTGLGLALCKATVRLMKGQLGVESKEGVGSTFWFKVPIRLT